MSQRSRAANAILILLVAASGCSERDNRRPDGPSIVDAGVDAREPGLSDAATPQSSLGYALTSLGRFDIGADGWSAPIEIDVPDGARSFQIVVRGRPESTYALGSLVTPAGVELSDLAGNGDAQSSLRDARIPPNDFAPLYVGLQQFATAESFVHTYPNDGSELQPGAYSARVLSTSSSESVEVLVVVPPNDGASVLHVNLHDVSIEVSDTRMTALAEGARAIFAAAGIRLVVDEIVDHGDSPLRDLTCTSGACTTLRPGSRYTELVRVGRAMSASDALDVYVVDLDPTGGVSLGMPGANDPESDLFGVFLHAANANDEGLGEQVVAHEIAHFLGLWHVSQTYPDPIADTDDAHTGGTCTNLMSYCGV